MKYWEFLCLFILPWLVIGSVYVCRNKTSFRSLWFLGNVILVFLAVTYTTPWDNYLVKTGVWSYPPDRVLGRIGYVPIEEYCFFVLQTFLTGMWAYFVISKFGISHLASKKGNLKIFGTLGLVAVWIFSLLKFGDPQYQYLSLILVWALPIVIFQWFVGADYFALNAKIFALIVLPVTIYLWIADAIALHLGIWSISSEQTLGVNLFWLPLEEALFFFVTNVMVGLGLIFFLAMEPHFPRIYHRVRKWELL